MSHLTAEVISIGDEMTCGARLDTNTQWLSTRLGELGIEVTFHSTVGDSLQNNVDVFRIACERADIIVCTGGLGPTRDDLTREALARLVGQPLELREDSLRHIESMFARRQREMPERNRNQAMFPTSAVAISNPQGTAPGVDLEVSRQNNQAARPTSRIFALPGVPAEMTTMFETTVAKRIMEISGSVRVIRQVVLQFFGTGESDMEHLLGDMIARDRQPRVGITVRDATISLRITAKGANEPECTRMIATTREEIMRRAGQYFFGEGEEFEQHHAVEEAMRSSGQSLLAIELGFAAPLGDWFAHLGDTPAYRGGLSLATKCDLVRLTDKATWEDATQDLLKRFDASHGLLVDRYPTLEQVGVISELAPSALEGEAGGHADNVDVYVVEVDRPPRKTTVTLGGHPAILHARIAKASLAWLRSCLR